MALFRIDGWPLVVWPVLYLGLVLNGPVFWRRFHTQGLSGADLLADVALVLGVSLIGLALLGAISRRLLRVSAVVLVLISAVAAYYMVRFNAVIGYGIIQAIFTTDTDLSKEVIGWGVFLWLLIFGLLPVVVYWRLSRRWLSESGQPPRWRRVASALALVFFGFLLLKLSLAWFDHRVRAQSQAEHNERPNPSAVASHAYVPTNWIAGVLMSGSNAWAAVTQERQLKDPAKAYRWQIDPQDLDDTLVVMVIGETGRWDHWSLLGYERETTPRMAALPDVVAMKGQSCNTSTKLSLACMFVRHAGVSELDRERQQIHEDNVFSVLKHLGFRIELYAMQSEVGFYNTAHTDFYKFREVIAAEAYNAGSPVDDMMLLGEVKRSLAARDREGRRQPQAFILHTKGSHYLYSKRYPRSFARYRQECLSADGFCTREQLINAYDNSILYTDHVLTELMGLLRERKALVFYASDHGESIDENFHLHGTPKFMAPPEQLAIPMMVWASPPWLAQPSRAARYAQLRARHGKPAMHQDLFSGILGCLGADSPNGGLEPAANWCGLSVQTPSSGP